MIFDSDFFRGLFADLFTIGIYGQCTFYFPARDGYFVVDFSRSGGLEIEIETLVPQFAVGVFDVDLTAFGRFGLDATVMPSGAVMVTFPFEPGRAKPTKSKQIRASSPTYNVLKLTDSGFSTIGVSGCTERLSIPISCNSLATICA